MAWIESHQGLRNHPKTKKLARKLNANIPAAVGYLHLLWWWSMDYAPDGDLSKYDTDDIADACEWDKDAQQFVDALIEAKFLDFMDGSYFVHDWPDYAGRLIEYRKLQSERTMRKRNLYDNTELTRSVKERDGDHCRYCGITVNWKDRKGPYGGTYDHVDPEGDNTDENIVVACRSCNAKKGRRTPEEANMKLLDSGRLQADLTTVKQQEIYSTSAITVPNRTVPNQREIKEDVTKEATPKKKKVDDKTIYAEFVKMKPDEYEKLVSQYGTDFAHECIITLDNYKGANNKRYASDYRAILNWVVKRVQEDRAKIKPFPKGGKSSAKHGSGHGGYTDDELNTMFTL